MGRSGPAVTAGPDGSPQPPPIRDGRGAWFQEATVVSVTPETAECVTLRLRLDEVDGFLPGQYYLVRLPRPGLPALERSFSVGSSPFPDPATIDLTVREMPGGLVSPLLVRQTGPGHRLQVRGPFGYFTWTEADGGPLALIGAGSGIVPLASIVRYQAVKGLAVPTHLLYANRRPADIIYRDELDHLARSQPSFTLTHAITGPDTGDLGRVMRGRVGEEALAAVFGTELDELLAYVSGAPGFVERVVGSLGALGVDGDRIRTEEYE